MLNIVYLNGEFTPLQDAKISVLDRGFLFGDGVYETIPVYNGHFFRAKEHLDRLENSLRMIRIENPYTESQWLNLLKTLLEKNTVKNAALYLQLTRGIGKTRRHVPTEKLQPTVFMACIAQTPQTINAIRPGITAVTIDDGRRRDCQMKSISLIASIVALEETHEADAESGIFIREGFVTEECLRNVFIVKNGTIKTPKKDNRILAGITRDVTIELAQKNGLPIEETDISKAELLAADEVFFTSSTKELIPVTKINGININNGEAGPAWEKLITLYKDFIANYHD